LLASLANGRPSYLLSAEDLPGGSFCSPAAHRSRSPRACAIKSQPSWRRSFPGSVVQGGEVSVLLCGSARDVLGRTASCPRHRRDLWQPWALQRGNRPRQPPQQCFGGRPVCPVIPTSRRGGQRRRAANGLVPVPRPSRLLSISPGGRLKRDLIDMPRTAKGQRKWHCLGFVDRGLCGFLRFRGRFGVFPHRLKPNRDQRSVRADTPRSSSPSSYEDGLPHMSCHGEEHDCPSR
jgi:hypothetical protein